MSKRGTSRAARNSSFEQLRAFSPVSDAAGALRHQKRAQCIDIIVYTIFYLEDIFDLQALQSRSTPRMTSRPIRSFPRALMASYWPRHGIPCDVQTPVFREELAQINYQQLSSKITETGRIVRPYSGASCSGTHLCSANCSRRLSWASATLAKEDVGTLNSRPHAVQTATAGVVPNHFVTLRLRFCIG